MVQFNVFVYGTVNCGQKRTMFKIKSTKEKYKPGAGQTQTSKKLEVGSDDNENLSSFVFKKLNCSQLFCV